MYFSLCCKTNPLKVYPHLFLDFSVDLRYEVARKVENLLCFFSQQTHASIAWNSSDCFESFSTTEGVITTRSNRMKFRLMHPPGPILGDLGADKVGARESLFSPFFAFLRALFFRPSRLSLPPLNLPLGLRGWPGPYFPAKSMEAAYWGLFRALGTNLNWKKDGARKGPESMVDFLLLSFSSTLQG